MAKQGDTKRKQLLRQHNVSRDRDHAADEASAAAAGVDLSALRKQAVFHFDVQRHALLPAMLRCLGFSATGSIEEDQALLEGLQPPALGGHVVEPVATEVERGEGRHGRGKAHREGSDLVVGEVEGGEPR